MKILVKKRATLQADVYSKKKGRFVNPTLLHLPHAGVDPEFQIIIIPFLFFSHAQKLKHMRIAHREMIQRNYY